VLIRWVIVSVVEWVAGVEEPFVDVVKGAKEFEVSFVLEGTP
jgi:hypothetical protein